MELARNLKIDSISRLQPSRPLVCERDCTIAAGVALMRKHEVGSVVICEDRKLVGIFTERDLLRRVIARGIGWEAPIGDVMTPDPVTLNANDSIRAAIRRMEEGGFRHLPIVDESNRPVGVLSIKRIVHYMAEHFPCTVYNLPPDPHAYPSKREGA